MKDIREHARPIRGRTDDFDPVLERIGDAPIVLLGEATHGTHEFYQARAEITRRLVTEKQFAAVIVEADWPDAYRVNRFVRGVGDDLSADAALGDFERFPVWMWRNYDVKRFVDWLRELNQDLQPSDRVGFYGMDLYSLFRSIDAVIAYLEGIDPEAAERARTRYSCFGYYGREAQMYGQAAGLGLAPSCEQAAIAQLLDMRQKAERHVRAEGLAGVDAQFFAEQNARLVKNAEQYYRGMFGGRVNTWNLRDHHMVETVEAIRDHVGAHGRGDKIVVWAHNSHLGDARATQWERAGQINVGQLLRERHGDDCVIVGFSTHRGTVTAASRWDGPAELRTVQPALPGSWERMLHEDVGSDFTLVTREAAQALRGERLNRAIGVLYMPQTERQSHYFGARLAEQFDVVLHYDRTSAVEPLEEWAPRRGADLDETYPFGV